MGGWSTGPVPVLLLAFLVGAATAFSKNFVNSSMPEMRPTFVVNFDMSTVICQHSSDPTDLHLHEMSILCDGKKDCFTNPAMHDESFPYCERKCNSTCNNRGACLYDGEKPQCYCNSGFSGPSCELVDKNECLDRPCHLMAHCQNTLGGYNCECFKGFHGDGYHCADIDECATEDICPEHSVCVNLPGTHYCNCTEGFAQKGDALLTKCVDINECELGIHNCDKHQMCENTIGSFTCVSRCTEGYEYVNGECVDIDECRRTNTCDPRAECFNSPGSYSCVCEEGMTGDGKHCEPITDCSQRDDICDRHALCIPALKMCYCQAGYAGDGLTCHDVNECEASENLCANQKGNRCVNVDGGYICCDEGMDDERCIQDKGAFCSGGCGLNAWCSNRTCECLDGFSGDPSKKCTDINECDADNMCPGVGQWCVNTLGNYTCCGAGSQEAECQGAHIFKTLDGKTAILHHNYTIGESLGETGEASEKQAGGFIAVGKGVIRANGTLPSISVNSKRACTSYCPVNSECVNGFCECLPGFGGNPHFGCEDINECLTTFPCQEDNDHWCLNTEGSFLCCDRNSSDSDCLGLEIVPGGMRLTHSQANQDGDDLFASTHNESSRNEVISEREHGSLNRSEGGFIIVQKNNNKTVPSDIVVLKPTATGTDSADLLKPSSGEEGLEIVPDRLTTAGIDGSIPQSRSTVSGEESTTALPIEAVTLPGVISTLGGHSTATTSIPITAIPVHIPQTPETKEVKSNTTTSIVVSSTLKPLTEIEGSGETTGIEDVDMLQTGKTSTVATPTPGGNINVHFTTLEELQKKNQTQTGATVATIQPAGGVTGKGSLETTIEGHNGSDVKVVDTVVGTTIRTIKVEGSGIEATTPGSHEDREDATAETGLEIILETTPTIVHHREATAPSIEQNTTSANKEEETTSTATSETTKADIKESESTTASQDKANGTTDKATSAVTQATEKIPETTSASEVTPDVTASSSAIGNDGNKPTTPSGSEETTVASAVTEESTTQTETSSVKGDETTSPSTSAKISAATTETTDPIPAARTTVKEAGATGATIEVPKETSTLETTTSIEDLNKKISDVLGKLKNSTKLPETTTEATGTKNLPTGEADSKKDEAKGNGTTLEPSTENPKRSDTKPETSKSTGGPTAVTTQAPVSATEETSAETGLEIANVEIEKTTPSSTVAYTADPKETAASTETTNKSEKATSTVAPGVTPEKVDTDETSSVALKSTPVTPETEKSIETTESTTTTTGVTPNKTTDKASFESSTKDETSQKPEPVPSSSSVPEVATSEKSAESTTSSVNSVETTTDNSAVFSTPKDVTGTTPSFKDITPATDSSTSIVEEGSGSEGKDTPGLVGEEGEKASTVVDDKIKTTARPTVADREPIGTIKTTEKPGNAQGVSSTEIPLTTEKTTAETGLEIVSEGTTVVAVGSPEETTSAPTEAATIVETVTETGSGGKNATSGIKTPEKGIGSKHISIVSSKEEPAPERDIHGGEETETQNGADGVHPTTESTTLETGLEIVHEKPLPTTTTPEVIEKTTTEDTTDGTAETGLEIVPAGTTTAGTEHTDETTTSPSSGKPVSTVSSSAESSTTSATVPSKTTEGSVSATSTESATKIVEPVTAAGKIEEKATKSPGIDGEIVTPLPDGDMTASPKTESTKQNRQPTGVTDLPGEGTTKDTFALPKDGSNQLATLTPNNVTKCVSGDECGDDAQCERRTGACRCYPGFEGAPPQTPCADVDECATGLHKCHSSTRCHNFVGGYACFCPMGYRKNESGVCIDIDECAESRGSCCSPNGMCFNKHGSYGCKCKPGFFGDGYNCMPVEKRACNETELTDAKCGQHNICGVDGLGNIDCDSCKMGFKMINGTCTDINECVEPGLSMCDKNANCNNLIGTYACQCKDGFRGDGYMCEDIDECTRNPCHPQAQCTNLPGSFLCACPSGFGGDGVKECTNPLEKSCEDVAGFCGRFSHTACLSVKLFNGSLSSVCECEPGYRFNKKLNKCEDIDECLENRHNCDPASATCINEDGGFHCECAEGYEGVGGVCVDVNECERGTAGCHAMAMCLNQPGSCGCKCMNGFTGDGTQCNPMQKREEEENLCTAEWNRLCLLENKTCHVDEEDVPQCGSCIEGHHPVNGSCQPLQGAGNCADPKKNTCDPNAECIDVHPGRHFCSCKVGYIGDGMRCDGPNCHLDGRLCHAEAECNIDGKCKCKSGFEGDGINNCTASTAGDKETTEAEPGKNGTTTVDGNVTTESMGTTAQTEPTTGTTTVVSEVTSVGTTVSTQVTTEKPDMSISGKPRLEATERPSTEHTTSVTPETTNASTSGLKTKGNAEPRTSSGTTVSTEGTTGQLGLEIARIPSNGTTTVASETTTSVTTLESKTNGSSESKSPAGTTISTRVTTEQPDTTISEKTELDITKVSSIGGSTSIASTSTASPSTSGIETNIGESSSSPDVTTETSPTGETTTDQGDFVLSFTKSTSTVAPSTTLQASSTGALSTGVSSGSTTEKPVTQTPSTESVVSSTTSQPAETTTGSESVLSASRTTKETSHSTAETPEFRASSTLSSTTSVSTTSDPAFTTKSASSSSSVGVSSVNPETSTSPSKTNKPPAESQTSTATTIASSITSTSGLTSLTDSSFVALKSTTEQPDLVLSGSKTTVKEEGSVSTGTTVVPTKSTVSSTVAVTSHASKTTLDLETTTPPSINAASTASMSESSTRPGVVIEIEDPDIVELVTGSSVVHLSGNKETLSSSTSAPTTVSTAAATSATAVSSSAFPTLGKTSSEPVPPSTTQAPKTTKSSAAPPSMTPPSFETTVTGETPATELYGSTETTTMASTTTTVPSIITTDDGVEVHTEQQKHAREHLKHAREHLKHGRCSADDRSECHELAICDLFSGSCKCKDGFEGDGFSTCRQVTNIDCVSNSSICHEQATCDRHTRRCACASGFIGDGILCSPDPQDCVIRSDLCSPDAMCSGRRCRCVEGFTGDGVKCVSLHQRSANCSECDANAHCDLGVCTCNPGYFGNGLCCVPDPRDCVHFPGICHPEAGCDRNKRQCACNKGFLGDGISCFPAVSCVSDPSVCHKNAICLPSGHCTCMRGFTGNGHHCERKFLSSPRQELQNQPSPCDNRCNRETQLCIDGDCVCKQGYDSINGDCQDIDECAISSPCHHLAACQNLRGSFSCHCPEGYIGDGHTCIQQLRIGELGVVCEPDGMTLVLANETQMFEGRIFVRGQAENPKCTKTFSPLQQHSRPYTFKVPFEHCNVRLEANDTFATTVIVQKHPMFITTSADSYDLKCTYPVGSTEVESHVNVSELATTSTLSDQADGPICKLTVNNELKESVESATVGQALTLRLEVSPSGTYSILPKNCFAINIETGERYSLTDKAGCAIDNDLFPDWAKVSSSVSQAIFRTFKWPDSQIIRFQCDCDACHGDCPEVDCQKRREAAARVFRFRRAHPTGEVPQDALEVETEKEEKALASKTVDSHRVAFSRLITVHEETEEKMAQEEVEHFHKGGSFLSESLPTVSRFPTEGVCFRTAVLAGSALLLVLSLGFLTTTALRRSRKAEAPPTDSPISVISF